MPTSTRQVMRREFGGFLGYGDKLGRLGLEWTTTSALTTGATPMLISTELRDAGFDDLGDAGSGDDIFEAFWAYLLGTGNANVERLVKNYDASAGQVGLTGIPLATGDTNIDFELHRYRPSLLHEVLNRARLTAFPHLYLPIHRTLFTARDQHAYEVPTAIIDKPLGIYLEEGFPAVSWANNLLTNEGFDTFASSVFTGWTAETGITQAQETETTTPKNYAVLREQNSARLTNGTTGTARKFYQTISSPGTHSGQRVAIAIWVYCMEAATVATYIRLNSTDHIGTNQDGGLHRGTGWELLTHYEDSLDTITTLRFGIEIAAAASTNLEIYVDEAIALAGPSQEPQEYPEELRNWEWRPVQEGTQLRNMVFFPYSFPDNRLLRFQGRGYLTEVTTETGTMEIAQPQTQLLYAFAAEELFDRLARTTNEDRIAHLQMAGAARSAQERLLQHKTPTRRQPLLIPDWSR